MKSKKMIIIQLIILNFMFLNCLGYDFHPRFQKGTTFLYREFQSKKSDKIIVSASSLPIGKKISEFEKPIYEYFLLSFYLGRLIGDHDNGNLFHEEDIKVIDYVLNDNEIFLVEISNVSYKSTALADFFLDYIPGGFFRIRSYRKKVTIKITTYEELSRVSTNSK